MLALIGNIFCGLLTAALLGPTGRGVQTAIGVAPLILAPIFALGLHVSLIYNIKADQQEAGRYFGAALVLAAVLSLLAIATGLMVLPFLLRNYDGHVLTVSRWLLLIVPTMIINLPLAGALEANERYTVANRVIYLQSLCTLLLLLLLVVTHLITPERSALAYFVPYVLSFVYLAVHAVRTLRPEVSTDSVYLRRLLRYGVRFYGVDLISAFSGYLDQMMIVLFLSPASVGTYAVALSLSRVLYVAQGAVATVLFPSIAGKEEAAVIELVGHVGRVTSCVNISFALLIVVCGPSLLLLLYGPRFAGATIPFLILLIEGLVSSAARTFLQIFSGTGRPSVVTVIEIAGIAVAFLAMIVMVPHYGLCGAAAANLLAGVARLGLVLVGLRRLLGVTRPRLIPSVADVAWVVQR